MPTLAQDGDPVAEVAAAAVPAAEDQAQDQAQLPKRLRSQEA